MWAGTPADELCAAWAIELGRFDGEDIRRALEAMRFAYKQFPPTLYEFADLCRDASRMRAQTVRRIDPPPSGIANAEVLAAVHRLTRNMLDRKRDPRDWARRILTREQAGERMTIYAVRCAKEALGIPAGLPAA